MSAGHSSQKVCYARRMDSPSCSLRSRRTLCTKLFCGAVALLAACSRGGEAPDGAHPDAALPKPADLAVPAYDLTPPESLRLLKTFSGCPSEMFESLPLGDDFDSQTQLDSGWQWQNDGRFPRPRLDGGSLIFGPHNLNPAEWWNNWTPVRSLAEFGDVLYCVRYRIKPPSGVAPGDSVFNTSIRGESGGMNIVLDPLSSVVVLNTRTTDTTWVEHGRAGMTFKLDTEQTIEIALYGRGSHYYGEVKNLDSGEVVGMSANYADLPAQGVVGMLGWRLKYPLYVDRAAVGTPSTRARNILSDK